MQICEDSRSLLNNTLINTIETVLSNKYNLYIRNIQNYNTYKNADEISSAFL